MSRFSIGFFLIHFEKTPDLENKKSDENVSKNDPVTIWLQFIYSQIQIDSRAILEPRII
jgi:hypothetical protein